MPVIVKKCFLFHYDAAINSDKIFNLFIIEHGNGCYSTISEYGRRGAKLVLKPIVERCPYWEADRRYIEKINEKLYHNRTPYQPTTNSADSPTFKEYGATTPGQSKRGTRQDPRFPPPSNRRGGRQGRESKRRTERRTTGRETHKAIRRTQSRTA